MIRLIIYHPSLFEQQAHRIKRNILKQLKGCDRVLDDLQWPRHSITSHHAPALGSKDKCISEIVDGHRPSIVKINFINLLFSMAKGLLHQLNGSMCAAAPANAGEEMICKSSTQESHGQAMLGREEKPFTMTTTVTTSIRGLPSKL
ncbi:hypothetical protein OPV22_011815 [Ensete ventricosum]|uniref:Uncharacterized protein n=1 Tax=Ensete ventricosum TaxID=4639 RepID=A0AAV8RAJ4_ENSVE|nr:hypothetical protein OPV22_011815 [Ensete ventricosum]